MPARTGTAHVVTTRRTYKGRVYETHLLRRSYRENGQVKKETLGNLSHLPGETIELIRRSLQGERFVSAEEAFEVQRSRAHGHVQAVRVAMQRLGMASLIGSKASVERDRVLALIGARVLAPASKLATTRWWQTTTLAEEFGVEHASEDDLYAAMDWLLERQGRIEKKLAARHLDEGALALYDLTSSYFEGSSCPLAAIGYSRDQKRNKPQVNYGLLTDRRGCPVAISVHAGNVADGETFRPLVQRVRKDFGVPRLVLVGDRGMISQRAIVQLREQSGIDWISALKSVSIRTLVKRGQLPLERFDETNLFELYSADYPGERLIACRNRALATRRAHKRQALLEATEANLKAIRDRVGAGRLSGSDAIGVQVGKVINQYKVGKHFELTITERTFRFQRRAERIEAEAALDGVYLIRTSLAEATMDAPECVRSYKALTQVERAFRSIKTIDLNVRPIHHRLETRVRAHLFVCMLAYYLQWHMGEAWRELTFADTELDAKATRDPVAPAQRSARARRKAATATLDDGTPAHSFQTLLAEMATLVRNTCQATADAAQPQHFELDTRPNPKQRRAFELLDQIHV